ncbi:hypothetical protein NMD86_06135 [Edwardsiella tarda]|uniref:hypothetical protein n=1 Tax=Edwardsiella tarda TaxID=636 RepID=UPI00351CB59F
MTTPVAITLTSLGAQSDSPTATTPAVDGSPFADILALLSQPGNKQALLQNLQASLDGDAKGPSRPCSADSHSWMHSSVRRCLSSCVPRRRTVSPLARCPLALLQTSPTATDTPRSPDVDQAGAQQAIAALLAMLPARADTPRPLTAEAGVSQHDDLARLLTPAKGRMMPR